MKKLKVALSMTAAILWGTFSVAFGAEKGLEGRWNIVEKDARGEHSSWLELTRDGQSWKARFLHRGGHAVAAEVQVNGDEVKVTMIPEGPQRPDAKAPTLTGRLSQGKLSGDGLDGRGNPFTWVGLRAPDRNEGSDRKVKWGEPVTLFNGKDLTGWKTIGSATSQWKAVDGILTNEASGANLRTVQEFRDFKLHIEFKIPKGSNSGIYLRGRYETQVADDYGKEPYNRGVGGIYGYLTPKVNAAKPAGEWNVVEATIIGYRVTIVVNGQTTIDGQLIDGITGGALDTNETAPGPIMLQGDHGPVYYRNIVLTPAK